MVSPLYMPPPPSRLRVGVRLAMLHELLPDLGTPASLAVNRTVAPLTMAHGQARAVFDALASSDVAMVLRPTLAQVAEAAAHTTPEGYRIAAPWFFAQYVIQGLKAAAHPLSVRTAAELESACNSAMRNAGAALRRLVRVPLGLQVRESGSLLRALVAVLGCQCADAPGTAAALCSVFVGHLSGVAQGGAELRQAAELLQANQPAKPAELLPCLRALASAAGDRAPAWVLHGAVAVLEGPPEWAGIAEV